MSEQWRTIPDTSGRYQVSSLGRVRNIETGRLLAQRKHIPRDGVPYLSVDLFTPGPEPKRERKKSLYVHCLVVAVFQFESLSLPDGVQAHHKDRNRQNNQLANLEGLTIEDHMAEHSEARLQETF